MTIHGTYPEEELIRTRLKRKEGQPTGAFRAVRKVRRSGGGEYGIRGWALHSEQPDREVVGWAENQPIYKDHPAVIFYAKRRDGRLSYNWGGPVRVSEVFFEGEDGSLTPVPLPE